MIDLPNLLKAFAGLSPREPRLFSAPGRVNLIGEHTDYNRGFVLPVAANLRTYVAAALRDDDQVNVYSIDLDARVSFSLELQDDARMAGSWAAYVQGMTQTLMGRGLNFSGADLAILSEVPLGAGLSSSAALEVSVGFALTEIAGWKISLLDLALAAQEAEHVYVGTNSGLMDQLTATFAKKNHAMFINCRSNQIKQIPMDLPATEIVICNTQVKHALVSSSYNERRQECEHAVELLQIKKPEVESLSDLDTTDLGVINQLPDPERRRARHVVTENQRTVQAAEALQRSDVEGLGRLMTKSHKSLRDDFEVSSRELDIMFELAQGQRGVYGSRMMGGGFGGCTINLVELKSLNCFINHITAGYKLATGLVPSVIVLRPDNGVSELSSTCP